MINNENKITKTFAKQEAKQDHKNDRYENNK